MVYEILTQMASIVPIQILYGIGAGLIRSIGGWFASAVSDGKLDDFEIKMLGQTVTRYVAYVVLLSFGMPVESSVVAAFGLEKLSAAIETRKA